MPELHLVPRSPVTDEDVQALADDAGWRRDPGPAREHAQDTIAEYRWQVDDRSTVSLVDNSALGGSYLVVAGPEPGDLAAAVTARFPCLTIDEIVASLAEAGETAERVAELHRLAAARPRDHRPDVARLVVEGLHDADDEVRIAALLTAFHLNWRQFRGDIETVAAEDGDANVRTLARMYRDITDWSAG